MDWTEVTRDDLETLRPGLQLIERATSYDAGSLPDLFLYGMTTNRDVLDAAHEVLQDEIDEDGGPDLSQLREVAVAIPASTDTLYYFIGSGLKLQNEEFAFRTPDEGPRTMQLTFANFHPQVSVEDFSSLCLQAGNEYLDEYLKRFGTAQVATPSPAESAPETPAPGAYRSSIDEFLA